MTKIYSSERKRKGQTRCEQKLTVEDPAFELVNALLTKKEAAAILRTCAATIYRLGVRGEIDVVRLGTRLVRYRRADIERLIAQATCHQAPDTKSPNQEAL